MKKILITGATGLVGKEIVKQYLEKQISIHYLTTRKNAIKEEINYKGFYWSPKTNMIDKACFEDVDTIINLAGATISKRWTTAYKKEVLNSRIDSLRLLKTTIKHNNIDIKHLISASAIGIYPSSLNKVYDENEAVISTTFLGEVVEQWEKEIDLFSELNIKTTVVRIGLVLAKSGGALPKILAPIKMGAGANFGDGKQWQSWIHVEDLAKLFLHLQDKNIEGVYNGVAPNPVTNSYMTKAIAKQLKKPLLLPAIPKTIMKLMLGEMHILLFESQNVSSEKIETTGFEFQYNTLEEALKNLV